MRAPKVWTPEEKRWYDCRQYTLDAFAEGGTANLGDIHGHALVENLHAVARWLFSGEMPPPKQPRKNL